MATPTRKKSGRIFFLKIDLPALFAFALFAGLIFFYLIPGFEKAMMDRKRNLIHEITTSAYSLLEYYHSLVVQGKLENDQAKEEAQSAISRIRYGDELKDYFWITDRHPRMIVHPYRPELNGTDLSGFRDSRGKAIFVEFVNAVSSTGESYVEYMWQWNDDSTRIVPKLSYVRLFEPWDWIIGTGIYIDDVRSEIRKMEFRALVISGLIAIVIIILLAAISKQSHNIEKKRNRAEEELHKSRELYKTLAEAASEGVIILSAGRVQANRTLLSWLGYSDEELAAIRIRDILVSPEFPGRDDIEVLYDELASRRYVECSLRLKDGSILMSHADFSRILLGGSRAVLVVIRPSGNVEHRPGITPDMSLLDEISTGFFKISYGRKNRFIFATKPVLDMLGFINMQELLPHTVGSLFANNAQMKAFRRALELKERITDRAVLLKRKDGVEFWAILNIMVVESASQEIWCEGTIELLPGAGMKSNQPTVDLTGFSASYIMKMPVSCIMRAPVLCRENLSAAGVLALMKEHNTDCVLITDENGKPVGSANASAVGHRLGEGGLPGTEIFRWMSSRLNFINTRVSVSEALRLINTSKESSLFVISDEKKISGLITHFELSNAFFSAPAVIFRDIETAVSSEMLHNIFLDTRELSASMILGHAQPYAVVKFISAVADAICSRVLTLCLEASGTPPCRFAFIQTGSAGRREQTLSTDQDNAIIFEDCEGQKLNQASEYFVSLGRMVNDMLSEAGFRHCPGKKMAGNPQWCQPLAKWKKYFSDWIRIPGPEEILEMSIFFDFRFCHGDRALPEELREYVRYGLMTSDIYFHHMASAWKQFAPAVSIRSDKKTDIKKILMPLTGIIRLYALKYGIEGFSTIERIIGLYSGNFIDHILLRDSIRSWNDLTSLRLTHHLDCIKNGKEPDNIVDFHLFKSEMICNAEQAASIINDLMLKAGSDFYTETI
jgi:signal-transduction protein with cAMP-binding, CBS, and nucleotidyltransferase domain/PAS domain-containing protein